MCAKMSSFSPDSLLLPHRVWKVKFVGENSHALAGLWSWGLAVWAQTVVQWALQGELRSPSSCTLQGFPGMAVSCWLSFPSRWICGWLWWWLQWVHSRDLWRTAEWTHPTSDRDTQWERWVRGQPRLLPVQPRCQGACAHQHVPLSGWAFSHGHDASFRWLCVPQLLDVYSVLGMTNILSIWFFSIFSAQVQGHAEPNHQWVAGC